MTTPKLFSLENFNAAIFDMDGLLIDSEPFWKLAERECFAEVGIDITEEMSRATAPMTTAEVAAHWYAFRPWEGRSTGDLEHAVTSKVRDLINKHGNALPGVRETLESARLRGWRIALASNSPLSLCEHVLAVLNLSGAFDVVVSAEQVARGKPSPDIYLEAAHRLNVPPMRCLAFEDSASGVCAACEAGMTVVAVPSTGQTFECSSHIPHGMFPSLSKFREINFTTSDSVHGTSSKDLAKGYQPSPNTSLERTREG